MELHTIGIDLGKTVFHLVGLNLRGEVVVRKKFSPQTTDSLHRELACRIELAWKPAGEPIFWDGHCASRGMRCG